MSTIPPQTITRPLVFASEYPLNSSGYQFLEIPDAELLKVFETSSSRLVFRGEPEDPVTLHTENATYNIRQVQTSNTFFLLNENTSEGSWNILHTTGSYLELAKSSPNFTKLNEMLHRIPPFSGHFEDMLPEASTYSFHQLLDHIQASEFELKSELQRMHAVEIHGILRVLEPHYLKDVLTMVVSTVVAQDWDMKNISLKSMTTALADFEVPESIVQHILLTLSESSWYSEDQELHAALSKSRISNQIASILLTRYNMADRIPYNDFLSKWNNELPEPLECDPSFLDTCGLLQTDPYTSDRLLVYISRDQLPMLLPDRLRCLFELQERWHLESIIFWIQDLVAERSPKRAEQWLLKNAKVLKDESGVWVLPRKDLLTLR